MKNENKSKGGVARAKSLSQNERSTIAKKAAQERWNSDLPKADHEGTFTVGGRDITCAVLPSGSRIITQAAFLRALGRSRSPKAKTGVLSTVDRLPFFLQADVLKPFISEDLEQSTAPVFFISKAGGKNVGYDARLLPQVADVYLKYRDHCLEKTSKVPKQYEHIIKASDLLTRALANVGIIALVDEATGYQVHRAKDALSAILEKFIAKELRPYIQTFPSEFYEHLFRLRGLEFPSDKISRPQYFGHLTNDIIYRRLAPGILEELKDMKAKRGSKNTKLMQSLSEEIGHPRLREHLAGVMTIMKISDDYEHFISLLDRTHPQYSKTKEMDFGEEDESKKL